MNYIHGTEARSVKPRTALYEFTMDEDTGTLYLERKKPELWVELPYISLLAAAVLFAVLSCCSFIRLTTDIHCRVENISELQSSYFRLYTSNEQTEKNLHDVVNLSRVYDIAVNERTSGEYVYQTENIPAIGYRR
jgi:hypothetical protein